MITREAKAVNLLIGIAIILILFFSLNIIEKKLTTIEYQNGKIIEVLEEIRDKDKLD